MRRMKLIGRTNRRPCSALPNYFQFGNPKTANDSDRSFELQRPKSMSYDGKETDLVLEKPDNHTGPSEKSTFAQQIIPSPSLHAKNHLNCLDQHGKIDEWPQMFDVIEVILKLDKRIFCGCTITVAHLCPAGNSWLNGMT